MNKGILKIILYLVSKLIPLQLAHKVCVRAILDFVCMFKVNYFSNVYLFESIVHSLIIIIGILGWPQTRAFILSLKDKQNTMLLINYDFYYC